jgi:hypothetical protein
MHVYVSQTRMKERKKDRKRESVSEWVSVRERERERERGEREREEDARPNGSRSRNFPHNFCEQFCLRKFPKNCLQRKKKIWLSPQSPPNGTQPLSNCNLPIIAVFVNTSFHLMLKLCQKKLFFSDKIDWLLWWMSCNMNQQLSSKVIRLDGDLDIWIEK